VPDASKPAAAIPLRASHFGARIALSGNLLTTTALGAIRREHHVKGPTTSEVLRVLPFLLVGFHRFRLHQY
jgi:hypothetical protein